MVEMTAKNNVNYVHNYSTEDRKPTEILADLDYELGVMLQMIVVHDDPWSYHFEDLVDRYKSKKHQRFVVAQQLYEGGEVDDE